MSFGGWTWDAVGGSSTWDGFGGWGTGDGFGGWGIAVLVQVGFTKPPQVCEST